jgi:hypothetical protein
MVFDVMVAACRFVLCCVTLVEGGGSVSGQYCACLGACLVWSRFGTFEVDEFVGVVARAFLL